MEKPPHPFTDRLTIDYTKPNEGQGKAEPRTKGRRPESEETMTTKKQNMTQMQALTIAADALAETHPEVVAIFSKMIEQRIRAKENAKPSAETLANAKIKELLLEILEEEHAEFTAAELAERNDVADADGMPLTSRKIARLLSDMAANGVIAKSPEKWPAAHYAAHGIAFKARPVTVRARKNEDGTLTEIVNED